MGKKWMSLAEALPHFESLEALDVFVCEGRAVVRAEDIYENGRPTGLTSIPLDWWAMPHVIYPVAERVVFTIVIANAADGSPVTGERIAIGVEIERGPVEPRWPAPTEPAPIESASRHAGGKDPENDWEGAAGYVDNWVAEHGPLPRRKDGKPNKARAVELMTNWFPPPVPKPTSIYRWLRQNPHPEWWL